MADAYKYFGLSCPSGGSFYICEGNATEFMGCCTTNPCSSTNNGNCPTANLRASSFSADTYTDLPRQDCDDDQSIKIWYTCKFNKPPFMGCCASNPCAEGLCAPNDLRPAKLSGDSELKAAFLNPGTPSSTATAVPVVENNGQTGLSKGAIGGICAGVAVLVILVVAAIFYKCGWHARRKKETKETAVPHGGSGYQDEAAPEQQSGFGGNMKQHYVRDSYLSGSTAYPSPRPDGSYPQGFDGKSLSPSPQLYGHHNHHNQHLSYISDGGNSHHGMDSVVELPVTYPAVQELPAEMGNPGPGLRAGRVSMEPVGSGYSTPMTVTPMGSPRMPEEPDMSKNAHNQYYGGQGGYDRRI